MLAKKKKQLTPKQVLFIQEYLVDSNATQAAIRAGYSKKTAMQIGEQNLRKLDIATGIAVAQAERAARTEITQDDTLRMVKDIADIDHVDYKSKRTSKGIEMLCRCQGMFNDKLLIGMDEATLNTILNTLPPEQAEKTKAALIAIAKKK